jgi:hypothetical protein
MLQAWRRAKVITWAGYILGFPTDTPETIARDIEIIKKELPIDILEFFCLTSARIEGLHPLQFGFVRRKIRTQRRYGMPVVNPLLFYLWRPIDFIAIRRAGSHWRGAIVQS